PLSAPPRISAVPSPLPAENRAAAAPCGAAAGRRYPGEPAALHAVRRRGRGGRRHRGRTQDLRDLLLADRFLRDQRLGQRIQLIAILAEQLLGTLHRLAQESLDRLVGTLQGGLGDIAVLHDLPPEEDVLLAHPQVEDRKSVV